MKRTTKKTSSEKVEPQALPDWQKPLLDQVNAELEKDIKNRPAFAIYWNRNEAEEWISRRCKAHLGLHLAFDNKGTQLGGQSIFDIGEEDLRKLFDQVLAEAVSFFGRRVEEMAKMIWSQALTETDQMIPSKLLKHRLGERESKPFLPVRGQWEDYNLNLYREGLRSHKLRDGRGGRVRRANLRRLSQHYDSAIMGWIEAYEMCRSALSSGSAIRRDGWRDDIKKAFPDFPEDLIERMQPIKDWPDQILHHCSAKGGEDKAEDIALEHAARLCGAKNYAYKLTVLRKNYNEQKRQEFEK